MLLLILAAGPVLGQTSPSPADLVLCSPVAGPDPVCELWLPSAAGALPWPRWQSWPVMVLPSWRYDRLCADAAGLPVCQAAREGDRAVAGARLREAVAAEQERIARERARADAAEAGLGVPWSYWLGGAGAVAAAAVLCGLIGADPLGILPWGG